MSFQSTTGENFLLQVDYLINEIMKENLLFHLMEPLIVISALIFSCSWYRFMDILWLKNVHKDANIGSVSALEVIYKLLVTHRNWKEHLELRKLYCNILKFCKI